MSENQSRYPAYPLPLIYLMVFSLIVMACSGLTDPEETGLTVSPESLDFGIAYYSLPLTISRTGQIPFEWRISEYPDWLTVSSASGLSQKADTSLNITAIRSDMADGEYTATLTVASDGQERKVPVSIKVNGPYLMVLQSTLQFDITSGPRILVVSNIGNGILRYQITTSADWLSVNPDAGEVTSRPQEVEVSVDRTDLKPGNYSAVLVIHTEKNQRRVEVTLIMPPDG
ncbi:MAG TPA: BACON domain-containing carbohydrate-binding protein [bacterium]|nr:BACON domain-containing carbohydrate-binding protein [bacterium]